LIKGYNAHTENLLFNKDRGSVATVSVFKPNPFYKTAGAYCENAKLIAFGS
jgi:hypothetical protein